MGGFWLGVFVGLAVWWTFNAVMGLAIMGREITTDRSYMALYIGQALLAMLLAVLTYTEVIL